MANMGPAPTPARLRLLAGARPSKVNLAEPIPADGPIEPPDEMGATTRKIFRETVAALEQMKIASPTDRDAIAAYAEAVDKHRKASRLLSQSPLLIQSKRDGSLVRNPALQVQRDNALLICRFAQEFGLTPSARARIKSDETVMLDESENPFAQGG